MAIVVTVETLAASLWIHAESMCFHASSRVPVALNVNQLIAPRGPLSHSTMHNPYAILAPISPVCAHTGWCSPARRKPY